MLQQSGLIQGLIFTQTREGAKRRGVEVGKQLVIDLAERYGDESADALIKRIQSADLREYLRLSEELISLAVWYRRYSTVLLKSEEADE